MEEETSEVDGTVVAGFFKVPNSFFDADRKDPTFFHFCKNSNCHFVRKSHQEKPRWNRCPECKKFGIETGKLTSDDKILLLYFYRCGNNQADIFPSFLTIAKVCGFSLSTAKRVVRKLTRMKLISHTRHRPDKFGSYSHNR